MEIAVLKEDSEGFEVMLKGESHTFPNMLTEFLDRNPMVEYAAYKIEHPLVGEPKLFFKLKGELDSEDVAVKDIKGVGPKTYESLHSIGILTAGQLLVNTPQNLSERTGIAVGTIVKIMEEARRLVPVDKFGYRVVLKEALTELKAALEEVKKGF